MVRKGNSMSALPPSEDGLGNEKSLIEYAVRLVNEGKFSEAIQILERVLPVRALGLEHSSLAFTLFVLGVSYAEVGRYSDAVRTLERALVIQESTRETEDISIASTLHALGAVYTKAERYDDAEALLNRALVIKEKISSQEPNDSDELLASTLSTLQALGALYTKTRRYQAAEYILKRALSMQEMTIGPESASTLSTLHALGMVYSEAGRYEDAEHLLRRILVVQERVLPLGSPSIAFTLDNLGMVLSKAGRYDEARSLLQHALERQAAIHGLDHPSTVSIRQHLVSLLAIHGPAADHDLSRTLGRKSEYWETSELLPSSDASVVSFEQGGRLLLPGEQEDLRKEILDIAGEDWLRTKNIWLRGSTPEELLGTPAEIQVRRLLRSIMVAAIS
jgi:tetratricopeptide (TPR) repeat protein